MTEPLAPSVETACKREILQEKNNLRIGHGLIFGYSPSVAPSTPANMTARRRSPDVADLGRPLRSMWEAC